jgi:CDP-diacylglycerol pyrophosphatase
VSIDEHSQELSRRQFVGYSGVAGTAAALAAAGLAPDRRSCERGLADLCGTTWDDVYLWRSVQLCVKDPSRPDCLVTDKQFVVLPGSKTKSTHDFLLVPTERIKGIECPLLWTTYKYVNYWHDAWTQATNGGPSNVTYKVMGVNYVGLGVNSVKARMQPQLHIHMAGFRPGAFKSINDQDSSITRTPGAWSNSVIEVDGFLYRALYQPNLDENAFVLLYYNVVQPLGEDMGRQTLLVTNREKGGGGFYVLNSQRSLTDPKSHPGKVGTNTCDGLLVYAT